MKQRLLPGCSTTAIFSVEFITNICFTPQCQLFVGHKNQIGMSLNFKVYFYPQSFDDADATSTATLIKQLRQNVH